MIAIFVLVGGLDLEDDGGFLAVEADDTNAFARLEVLGGANGDIGAPELRA